MATSKKSSGQSSKSSSAKAASKATSTTFAAVENSRASAEKMMQKSSEVLRDLIAGTTGKSSDFQEKMVSASREATEQFSRAAENASRSMNQMAGVSRDNMESFAEVSEILGNIAKEIGTEMYNYVNDSFAQNMEFTKEAMGCRTVNDLFDLCNRCTKTNIDSLFNQTMRMSDMLFEYAEEAAEPINERVAEATERFSQAMAA